MAGISKALKRVAEHKNKGKVLTTGVIPKCDDPDCPMDGSRFALIRLADGGTITEYDCGSDTLISLRLKPGDSCELCIVDNYTAIWMPEGIWPTGDAVKDGVDTNSMPVTKTTMSTVDKGIVPVPPHNAYIRNTLTGEPEPVRQALAYDMAGRPLKSAAPPETLREVEEVLRYWLDNPSKMWNAGRFDWDLNTVPQITPNKDFIRMNLFTHTYVYSIVAYPGYLGCQSSPRMPLPGVDGTGGSDLADGKFCYETWVAILHDIVGSEMVLPAQPIAKLKQYAENIPCEKGEEAKPPPTKASGPGKKFSCGP